MYIDYCLLLPVWFAPLELDNKVAPKAHSNSLPVLFSVALPAHSVLAGIVSDVFSLHGLDDKDRTRQMKTREGMV